MSRPIERLFVIDEMIRSGDYPSIQTFMRRFHISERSAYGDVQYLKRRFHAPLQFSRKQGGYFYTLIGWALAKADTFTEEDAHLPPTEWLWKEIVLRFGEEAASDLRQDFQKHLTRRRFCVDCGKPLPHPTHHSRKYCYDCSLERERAMKRKTSKTWFDKHKADRSAYGKRRYQEKKKHLQSTPDAASE